MDNNLFDRAEYLLRIKDYDNLLSLETELKEYAQSCSDNDKDLCSIYLKNIEVVHSLKMIEQQQKKLKDFINSWNNTGILKLEYIEPYGNSFGVDIYVDRFVLEITYKCANDADKNEIRSKFFISNTPVFKQFVLKKGLNDNDFENLQRFRKDYYVQSVTYSNWADTIIDIINTITNKLEVFLRICENSCPYNPDGSHKFKSWKTTAKVEISYADNTGVVQGIKKGEDFVGSHVVGGNGSFRYWNKGKYVLNYTVEKLACEKPIKYTMTLDVDEYLRDLKDRLGRKNMPYDLLNSKLSKKIEVITHDMNKNPEDRDFYPVEFNQDWLRFLETSFKDLF